MDASVQRQIGFLSGLSEEEFFGKFLLTNKPCLFDAQMTREWRSRREWVTEGKPDVKYLKTMFGMYLLCIGRSTKMFYDWFSVVSTVYVYVINLITVISLKN